MGSIPNPKNRITPTLTIQQVNQDANYRCSIRNQSFDLGLHGVSRYIPVYPGCQTLPAFSGIPNAKRGEQNRKWSPTKGNKIRSGYLTPAFSGAPKEGGNATSPLHSQGIPKQRGTKSEEATSPLPSRGPKGGRKCYVTPAFSAIPNTKRGEQNRKWSPTKGNKIRSDYLTLAFSRTQKRVEMPHNPCDLGGP